MEALLTAAEMKAADGYAISHLGIPELVLMEHAALGVAKRLVHRFNSVLTRTSGVIVAGPGNNGGDALALARLLFHRGVTEISIFTIGQSADFSSSTQHQLKILEKLGLTPQPTEKLESALASADWIVDGIFGTGLSRHVDGAFRKAIHAINVVADRKWVVAIDLPSGLCADRGVALGIAVKACETVTLGFFKRGLVTGEAADYTGRVWLASIQIPRMVPGIAPSAFLFLAKDAEHLPPRRASGHKGDYGHVYIWAGEAGKQGAAAVAARGALRAGAGLVTLIGKMGDIEGIRPRLMPEIMTKAWEESFPQNAAKGAIVAVGPGMGTEADSARVLETLLKGAMPLVVDADALNLVAMHAEKFLPLLRKRAPDLTVMTPHPKEAARLLGVEVSDIQADRYAALKGLVEKLGCWVVLKGKGTLVGGPGQPAIATTAGDSGLSKGGTGDLLTGIASSLLAQGLRISQALPLAAYLHGRASELVTHNFGHERSTLATDIAETLPMVFKELECPKPLSPSSC